MSSSLTLDRRYASRAGSYLGTSEMLYEVPRVNVAYPLTYLLYSKVGLGEQLARFRHAALGDPLKDSPPWLAPDDRSEMNRRKAHRPRHFLE